jgi:hypothetical protein
VEDEEEAVLEGEEADLPLLQLASACCCGLSLG